MEKGNNKHRYGYCGMKGVTEEQKWGRQTAEQRYGPLKFRDGAPRPPDKCYPQMPEDKPVSKKYNDTPTNSWLRGGSRGGESKPRFDFNAPSGNPRKWNP